MKGAVQGASGLFDSKCVEAFDQAEEFMRIKELYCLFAVAEVVSREIKPKQGDVRSAKASREGLLRQAKAVCETYDMIVSMNFIVLITVPIDVA